MPSLLTDADLLARLVGFDSTSQKSNLPLADFICDYLDRPGIRIRRNPSPDGVKANLVIQSGQSRDPKTRDGLVLCGHMDVVPALEEGWRSDPFVLWDSGDAYVARGACDMKGFMALAINRMATLESGRVREPLALVFTYDEELGTLGAKHFVESWSDRALLPRRAIVGEPTTLRAVRMHKGHLKLRLGFRGIGGHSGYPHLGKNAIEPAGRAIVALSTLRQELERETSEHSAQFAEVPYVALNLAQIVGGTAINVIPDRCVLDVGLRVLPGMRSGDLVERVRGALAGGTPYDLEVLGDSPPMLLGEHADIYRTVCAAIGQEQSYSVSFATDAGWLQTIGLDCVIFGPGTIETAHKPNESLQKDEFLRAGRILDLLVSRICLGSP